MLAITILYMDETGIITTRDRPDVPDWAMHLSCDKSLTKTRDMETDEVHRLLGFQIRGGCWKILLSKHQRGYVALSLSVFPHKTWLDNDQVWNVQPFFSEVAEDVAGDLGTLQVRMRLRTDLHGSAVISHKKKNTSHILWWARVARENIASVAGSSFLQIFKPHYLQVTYLSTFLVTTSL